MVESQVVHLIVDGLTHGFDNLVIGKCPKALRKTVFQRRPVFDDEAVNRGVIYGKVSQALNIAPDVLDGLPRQAVHQIDRQVTDAGVPSSKESPFSFFRRMDTAQKDSISSEKDWMPRLKRLMP